MFAAGDYAGAAMFGDTATYECHAARAVVRGDRASLAALADFACPEARLHLAAARWIHGDTARARRELAGLTDERARRLAALLDRGRIQVLSQLPWEPGSMTDLLGGARSDPAFVVRNIGPRTGDRPNPPYGSIRQSVDDGFVPDFYVAAMVEWHHLPPDLHTLPCPLFGHIADHDLHIQTITPWLSLFDELCVTDRTEWLDVQGLGRGTVSSFPKVFGLTGDLPPIPGGNRHLDFFVSGTMLDPYHPDKAKLLHELLAMPGIDLRVVRGFMGTRAFHALLAASKVSFTYVRRPGAMPTRGLESLAFGCAVALQQECSLNLWLDREHGVVTYGSGRGELAGAVRTVLDGWDHFAPAAQRGAELVRREFAMERVASQYLRFLTFRSTLERAPRPDFDTTNWCQKRSSVSRGWVPTAPRERRLRMQANFRRLGAQVARQPSARLLVDMARELVCEFAYYQQLGEDGANERQFLADAVGLLAKCEQLFPRQLAARFLRVRVLWHHGDAGQRELAVKLAREAIESDPCRWQIELADDVMPFDFHGAHFNYRDYLDLLAAAAKGVAVPGSKLAALVLAALAGYVARASGELATHRRAVELDPAFARYRLDLAKALLAAATPAATAEAGALLVELADGSTEFAGAGRLLQSRFAAALDRPALLATAEAIRRMGADTIDADLDAVRLFEPERRASKLAEPMAVAAETTASAPRLAVLVPQVGSPQEMGDLLDEVGRQSATAGLEIVVAVAPDQVAVAARVRAADARVVLVPAAAGFAERCNACVRTATASLLTLALPGDRFRPDAFAVLRAAFHDDDVVLAFGNEGWTAGESVGFDPAVCVGFSVPAPFSRARLLRSNLIGNHPMWRRSLHDCHGELEPAYGPAAEYEFWLRSLGAGSVRQLPQLLVTSCLQAAWRSSREAGLDPMAVARVRRLHAGELEPIAFEPQRLLPAQLFAPGLREEARSHTRLHLLTDAQRREIENIERFHGTALLHGDFATAACLLQATIDEFPLLVSPRLSLALLRDTLGQPGAEDILRAAGECHPYAVVAARRLAALGLRQPDHQPKTEPCPV